MKNFTGFKYQKSVLRTVEEPPVKKKFNWDRFLFIMAILLLTCYIVYKTYTRVALVTVNGQVLIDKMNIHFTEDVRIREIFVEEGQSIEEGDTLFSYRYEDRDDVEGMNLNLASPTYRPSRDLSNWFLREKMNVKRQIAMKKSEIEGVLLGVQIKKRELEEQKKQILLGVDVAYKIPPLLTNISELEADINVLKEEIKVLRKHLAALRVQEKKAMRADKEAFQEKQDLALQSNGGGENWDRDIYYICPIDGLIGRILNSPNEVCYESENVMTVHKLDKLKIRAYFDQESHREIKIGDEVTVQFPDGTIGRGVIHNFYISTYPLPPEFQNKHEPMERSVVADVLPLNEEEARHWTGYYKMAVKIIKSKL